MGVVHLGLDPDGKAVAIKVLRQHIASDPDARRRLAREVATLRRIRHPQIAAVIDADVECEIPYVVTTFVPGKPLDIHVRDHGPLPRGHVARIGSVLAEALREIHRSGVVHRDLKPANVMLLDGDPILIDFGIAHVADESRITHTGLVMGTPGYLSPEIIGGEPVTEATDWWGWGATLAFAATGRPPFGNGPIEVVLDRVRRGQCDVEGVDAGLRATLTAALSVDPIHRPSPERLVAGLAAIAPSRHARKDPVTSRSLPTVANAAPRTVANAAASWMDAATERTPAPNEARAGRPPQPTASGEAVTAVVPPPAPWGSPALPETRHFDPPKNPGGQPNGYAGGPGNPNGQGNPNSQGAPNGQANPNGPANGFAGQNNRSGPAAGRQQAPVRPPAGPPPPAPWQSAPASAGQNTGDDAPAAAKHPGDPARGVLLGLVVTLAAVAGVAPYGATWIAALLIVAARVVDRSSTALSIRRDQRGPRGSDALMLFLGLPWRMVSAGLVTAVGLILPVLIGISVAFIVANAPSGTAIRPGTPGPLAAGMLALLLTAWFGPGGGGVRNGANRTVRFAVTGPRAQIVVWSLLALILASAVLVARGGNSPDWGPLTGFDLVQQLTF
jgi:serine/threonine protein kinase